MTTFTEDRPRPTLRHAVWLQALVAAVVLAGTAPCLAQAGATTTPEAATAKKSPYMLAAQRHARQQAAEAASAPQGTAHLGPGGRASPAAKGSLKSAR